MKQLGVLGKQIDKMCEVNRGGTWSETPVQINYFGRFTFTNKIEQIYARDAKIFMLEIFAVYQMACAQIQAHLDLQPGR